MVTLFCHLVACCRFFVHFEASCCLQDSPVMAKDTPLLLPGDHGDVGTFADEKNIVVNLVTGVPGSHQQRVCDSIATTLNQTQVWVLLLEHKQ